MRLIDADKLEFYMAGPFVRTYAEAREALREAPTVSAVPLDNLCEWLESRCLNGVRTDLLQYAVALLKEQEPRLLTAEEAEKVPEGKIVWVEQHTREKDYLMPMAATGDGRFGNFYLGILWKEVNTRFYRMWASKPTDEQREAKPWQ